MSFRKNFRRKSIFIFVLFLALSSSLTAQTTQVIIKLKQNAPAELLTSFRNNSIRSDKFSVTKTLSRFNVTNSKLLFDKIPQGNFDNSSTGLERIF